MRKSMIRLAKSLATTASSNSYSFISEKDFRKAVDEANSQTFAYHSFYEIDRVYAVRNKEYHFSIIGSMIEYDFEEIEEIITKFAEILGEILEVDSVAIGIEWITSFDSNKMTAKLKRNQNYICTPQLVLHVKLD